MSDRITAGAAPATEPAPAASGGPAAPSGLLAGSRAAPSPHLHEGSSTAAIMLTVAAALAPAGAWGVYVFGLSALRVILAAVGASLAAEGLVGLLRRRFTLHDGSALVTGLLVGYCLPPAVPLFIPVAASAFAIIVVKQAFGGLGRNWMNPALAARVFVMFSWPGHLSAWSPPGALGAEALTGPTPLGLLKTGLPGPVTGLDAAIAGWLSGALGLRLPPGTFDRLLGNVPGCIGEVSALLLLLGAGVLIARRIVSWQIPAAYLGSFGLLVWIFGGLRLGAGLWSGDVPFHLLSGGLLLGALYMAADPVTSPLTRAGMAVFGLGAGLLTFLIRIYGSLPEGVAPAIIIMNMLVPLIDRCTKPRGLGAAGMRG